MNILQIFEKIDVVSGKTTVSCEKLKQSGLKEFNEIWSNEIQSYEACKVSVASLIKKIKTLEKEKVEAKKTFITKMEVFEKKWVEVTKTIKIVSSVQKETNKLWNTNLELKETLSKDVDTLNSKVSQLVSSSQQTSQQNLSQVNSEINNLAALRQKVEKTKDLLNANSLSIYSAISKVSSAPMEADSYINEVIFMNNVVFCPGNYDNENCTFLIF